MLGGLSRDEREFAKSFISMGFAEKDVLRTMQKYGKDHKAVRATGVFFYVLLQFLYLLLDVYHVI